MIRQCVTVASSLRRILLFQLLLFVYQTAYLNPFTVVAFSSPASINSSVLTNRRLDTATSPKIGSAALMSNCATNLKDCTDVANTILKDDAHYNGRVLSSHEGGNTNLHSRKISATHFSRMASWCRTNHGSLLAYSALLAAVAFWDPSMAQAVSSAASVTTANVDNASSLVTSASTLLARLAETGFYQAFSLVFVSEIGDKTFFIAGLLAMKVGRFISFVGSVGALAVMTIISVIIGQLFHAVPTGLTSGLPLDDFAAVLAFGFFGFKTLKDASEIKEGDVSGIEEELEEAETAVKESQTAKKVTAWGKVLSTFGLVFAAELGDRSFISTIALSAAQEPIGVAFGAIAAHAFATGIAVAGGSYVSKYISEKVIGYIGGTLFLVFAFTTALGIF